MHLPDTLRRLTNGARRVAARLPPSEEAVWPGVRNDLFVAHESVYAFAARFVQVGSRVLDCACGTGYGSHALARAGAGSVLGIDRDRRRVAYARRCFRHPGLDFAVVDCNALDLPPADFDLVVSSNTLEHLPSPLPFLGSAAQILAPGGRLLVTVPPVLSEADLRQHASNRFHVSPLSVRAWAELFKELGWTYRFFVHRCRRTIDLSSPHPTCLQPEDFEFVDTAVDEAYRTPPLSVTFLLERPGAAG